MGLFATECFEEVVMKKILWILIVIVLIVSGALTKFGWSKDAAVTIVASVCMIGWVWLGCYIMHVFED